MFYFNPALWYFGLLLQLYLVFPVLFRMLQRLGPVAFLAIGTLASLASRRILLMDYVVSGNYVEGGFFLPRSYGFMLGMVFGLLFRKHPERSARWLFSPLVLAFGVACELAGIYSYSPLWRYVFNDVLVSSGFTILIAHAARLAARFPAVGATLAKVGAFSYGLYLVHQPFVLYFAPKLAKLAIPDFTVLIASLIVVLTITAMAMERRVNALTQRVLG
jgi:peptidoglycan/LPS O-acetylase OafA/YrhL